MARQSGTTQIQGSFDDLCCYKMNGNYYVRLKSSLSSKKFWSHKTFERSRESCKRFSEGNKLASTLYRTIEQKQRVYRLFCFLKRRAILLLKEGKSLSQAEAVLMDYLKSFGYIEDKKVKSSCKNCKSVKRVPFPARNNSFCLKDTSFCFGYYPPLTAIRLWVSMQERNAGEDRLILSGFKYKPLKR